MSIITTAAEVNPLSKEKKMLTWYYDSSNSRVFDLLDTFKGFEDFDSRRTAKKTRDTIDEEGIKVELPGVKREAIDITVEGRTLKISGKSKHEKTFSYSYSLRSSVDESAITATYEDGLLEIKLPKKQESIPRKIAL
jgi:HSP20 family molecular chaperone IbpA